MLLSDISLDYQLSQMVINTWTIARNNSYCLAMDCILKTGLLNIWKLANIIGKIIICSVDSKVF